MNINGKEYVGVYEDMPADHIRVWYDRSLKMWTITTHDAEDNQLGNADYAHSRNSDLHSQVEHAKWRAGVTKVIFETNSRS